MNIDYEANILKLIKSNISTFAVLTKIENAINEYNEEQKHGKNIKNFSYKSLKNFLYLVPMIEEHNNILGLSIDADTGFVDMMFNTKDHGLLTSLVTGNGEIHFSRVSRGEKIVKISGVVKIKDNHDFSYFSKVLKML